MCWASPGPAGVHLDDLVVSRLGAQQPGLASVFRGAAVVWSAVTVQDVVAVETLGAAGLLQHEVLRLIREVEGSQRRLLEDDNRTAR